MREGWREGEREGGREGERQGGKKGGREGARKGRTQDWGEGNERKLTDISSDSLHHEIASPAYRY